MSKLQSVSTCFSMYEQELRHEDWTWARSGMLFWFFHHI